MKRVLIISYYWPPTGGSGVQRWVKFAKYLPAEGWQPVVYTPENPEQLAIDYTLMSDIPEQTEVIKRKIFEPYSLYRKLLSRSGHDKEAVEVNPVNAQNKSFLQKAAMWVRGNLFRPDPRCLWINPSVRFLKKYLKEHPVDLIVSTGPPQSMHIIGYRLASATGIPWLADFRDPWTKIFYFKHLSMMPSTERWHHKMEKKVLDNASLVVAVSPLVQQELQAITDTPVELVTNGFDECDFPDVEDHKTIDTGEKDFIITHTGLFAADGNPEALWKVLSDKCNEDEDFKRKLKIRLIGKTDCQIIAEINKAGLTENLQDMGYLSHNDAVKEQRKASMLILPLRKEPEYKAVLPGKLFEYIASRTPILGIGQADGAMSMILSQTSTGKVCEWNDSESMKVFINECWNSHLACTSVTSGADISRFTRKELTGRMVTLFERITRHE